MSKGSAFRWEYGKQLAREWVAAHDSEIERAAIVGSVLREAEECHDVDILVIPKTGMTIVEADPPINIFITTHDAWEPALMQYAPSAGSTIGTRARAKEAGYKLNQYGLFSGTPVMWSTKDQLVSVSARRIVQLINSTLSQWVDKSLNGKGILK
jgi:DNA polymerase/3'-5' exonuclease PolX